MPASVTAVRLALSSPSRFIRATRSRTASPIRVPERHKLTTFVMLSKIGAQASVMGICESSNLVIRVIADAIAAGRGAVTAEEMTAETNGQPEAEAEAPTDPADESLVQEEVPAE